MNNKSICGLESNVDDVLMVPEGPRVAFHTHLAAFTQWTAAGFGWTVVNIQHAAKLHFTGRLHLLRCKHIAKMMEFIHADICSPSELSWREMPPLRLTLKHDFMPNPIEMHPRNIQKNISDLIYHRAILDIKKHVKALIKENRSFQLWFFWTYRQ